MRAYRPKEEVHVFTTPRELREIADRLEAAFTKAVVGDNVPRERCYGENFDLIIMVDQTAILRENERLHGK